MVLFGWELRGGPCDDVEPIFVDLERRVVLYNDEEDPFEKWWASATGTSLEDAYYDSNMAHVLLAYLGDEDYYPSPTSQLERADQARLYLLWSRFANGEIDAATLERERPLCQLPEESELAECAELEGLALASDGSFLVSDRANHCLWRVPPGPLPAIALGHGPGYRDGPEQDAEFHTPGGIDMAADGALFVADRGNHCIRRLGPDGIVTTVVGAGRADNLAVHGPRGLALDGAGALLIADADNHCVRRLLADGTLDTLAGSVAGFTDGPALTACFRRPRAIALAPDGTLYVADSENHAIRRVSSEGIVSTLAGGHPGYADGQGKDARFNKPCGLAWGPDGNLYVADTRNHAIRRVTPAGDVSTLAANPAPDDTTGSAGPLREPRALAFDPQGDLVVPPGCRIDREGNVFPWKPPTDSREWPGGEAIAFLPDGTLLVSAAGDGGILAFGDNQRHHYLGPDDVHARDDWAPLARAGGVVGARGGGFYVSDALNDAIWLVNRDGTGRRLVGSPDGPAPAHLCSPSDVAVGPDGTLYIADHHHERICQVDPTGRIEVFTGQHVVHWLPRYGGATTGVHRVVWDPKGHLWAVGHARCVAFDAAGNPGEVRASKQWLDDVCPLANGDLLGSQRDGRALLRSSPAWMSGEFENFAGYCQGSQDGRGIFARFGHVTAIAPGPDHTCIVLDAGNRALRQVDGDGRVTTIKNGIAHGHAVRSE